jgi:hypothetical protein
VSISKSFTSSSTTPTNESSDGFARSVFSSQTDVPLHASKDAWLVSPHPE